MPSLAATVFSQSHLSTQGSPSHECPAPCQLARLMHFLLAGCWAYGHKLAHLLVCPAWHPPSLCLLQDTGAWWPRCPSLYFRSRLSGTLSPTGLQLDSCKAFPTSLLPLAWTTAIWSHLTLQTCCQGPRLLRSQVVHVHTLLVYLQCSSN